MKVALNFQEKRCIQDTLGVCAHVHMCCLSEQVPQVCWEEIRAFIYFLTILPGLSLQNGVFSKGINILVHGECFVLLPLVLLL